MSWWVYLEGDDGICESEPHEEGGTYVLGGAPEAELNVTYNYSGQFRAAWPEDIEGSNSLGQMLDGRTGAETEPLLAAAVENLGTERADDYWDPTPGNAGAALSLLLKWARANPDARWRVS